MWRREMISVRIQDLSHDLEYNGVEWGIPESDFVANFVFPTSSHLLLSLKSCLC